MSDQVPDRLIEQIVRTTLDHGGTTADLRTMQIHPAEDAWYFPRFPERTMIVALTELASSVSRFIDLHREALITGDLWLGTWINPESRRCYLDLITRSVDRQEALALARHYSRSGGRTIIAICNPLRGLTVDLDNA